MIKNSLHHNFEMLSVIAQRLEELCEEVTFVGGCILGLLITDEASPDVRFTVDVDCIANIITLYDYHQLEKKLRRKGFKEMAFGNHPICRWRCDDTLIDVVPIEKSVLGFSNKWYRDAYSNSLKKIIDTRTIKIISAPYFLATKIEAFKDRGNDDYLLSHDLEDIISIIDGRPEIIEDISICSKSLKQFLSEEFFFLTSNEKFNQALPGHLNYSNESEERKKVVKKRIQSIIDLGG